MEAEMQWQSSLLQSSSGAVDLNDFAYQNTGGFSAVSCDQEQLSHARTIGAVLRLRRALRSVILTGWMPCPGLGFKIPICWFLACLLIPVVLIFLVSVSIDFTTPGLRPSECPSAYYTATACLLGGQDFRVFGKNSAVWLKLFFVLGSASPLRVELDSILSSKPFLEAGPCPRWLYWNTTSQTCSSKAAVPQDGCVNKSDGSSYANFSALPANESENGCAANIYSKVSGDAWGGECTCPDGNKYYVADGNSGCLTINCFGGTPGVCGPDGIPERAHGMQVSCQQDPRRGSELLSRAEPEMDVSCWGEHAGASLPRYMSDNFKEDIRETPLVHLPRAQVINAILGSDEYGKNKAPIVTSFGDFWDFYRLFYTTRAGDLCHKSFGPMRNGGPLLADAKAAKIATELGQGGVTVDLDPFNYDSQDDDVSDD